MFVKWSCGCKGFIVDGKCWVINSCDQDLAGPHERDMRDRRRLVVSREEREKLTEEELDEMVMKTHEPLPYDEVCSLLIEMGRLISDGYAFRQLRSLLTR